jgi:Tol biopolymer transport system component
MHCPTSLALWSILLLALGACGDDDTAAQPTPDWLTYQTDTSPTEVRVVRADGTADASPTADVPGDDQTNPDWSPDGTRLVFAATVNGVDSLWTVNADGTSASMLLECAAPCIYYDDPAWSPDGTKVLYSRMSIVDGNTAAAIETVDIADGTVTELLAADAEHFFAGTRYSPDGKSVVFEHVHKTGPSLDDEVDGVALSVFDIASPATTVTALTDPGVFAATADWGPNGELIVFSALPSSDASAPDLFTIRPDGSALTRVTTLADDGGAAEEPAWSGDATSIYFKASLPEGGGGIAVVPVGGGDVKPAWGDAFTAGRHPRVHAVNE